MVPVIVTTLPLTTECPAEVTVTSPPPASAKAVMLPVGAPERVPVIVVAVFAVIVAVDPSVVLVIVSPMK